MTLANSGALSTEFQVELVTPQDELEFTKSGRIDGYSSFTISVSLKAKKQGEFQNSLRLTFTEVSALDKLTNSLKKNSPSIVINIMGYIEDSNVYLENDTLDFKICSLGCTYRDTILLHNRGRSASHCN